MATETAKIKIDVDVDEIRALIAALQALSNQADDLDKDLKDVEGQAKDTDDALDKMKGSMLAGAVAGGTAAAAMAAFGAAVELVKAGIEQFKQGLESLSETNSQVAAGTASVSNAMTSLRETMVLALLGGDDMNQTFGAVTAVLRNFERIIQENSEQIAEFARVGLSSAIEGIAILIDLAGSLVIGFNNLKLMAKTVELGVLELINAWVQWNTMVIDYGLAYIQLLIDGFTALVQTMENVANVIPGVNVNLSGMTDVSQNLSDGIDNLRGGIDNFAQAVSDDTRQARTDYDQLATSILQTNDNIRESTNSLAGSFSMISDLLDGGLTESYVEATETQEGYNRSISRTIDLLDKLNIAKEQEVDKLQTVTDLVKQRMTAELELANTLAQERMEAAEALKTAEIEGAQKLSDTLLEIKESETEKLIAAQEAEAAEIDALYTEMESRASSFAQGYAGALAQASNAANPLKKLGKALKESLGDQIISEGTAQIRFGLLNLIPPPFNPKGNPAIGAAQIAAGTAAVVAGSKLKGGGGGSASAGGATGTGRAVPQTQGQNAGGTRTIVLNNSFNGLTTDPRGTARQLEDTLQSNQRLFGE